MTTPVYFTDADGERWRVLDARWRGGRWYYADPPVRWATTRVFVAADRRERFVSFGVFETHPEWTPDPTSEMLAILFARSERGKDWTQPTLGERAEQLRRQNDERPHP